jgi:hypothetical protein
MYKILKSGKRMHPRKRVCKGLGPFSTSVFDPHYKILKSRRLMRPRKRVGKSLAF